MNANSWYWYSPLYGHWCMEKIHFQRALFILATATKAETTHQTVIDQDIIPWRDMKLPSLVLAQFITLFIEGELQMNTHAENINRFISKLWFQMYHSLYS